MEVIRLDNIYKKFIIHHQKNRSFQDMVVNLFRQGGENEEFWALKDVSLDVQRGEMIGIIGENGSGKSTLLKLITRILDPTTGRVTVNGTISALLELGAGFHPDLTGRENVYLNGSILGISRKEMERRFDQIVEFSELDRFIDTPIKHYSSGMYMRLAFSIATAVDPEILLVDEILAVGDESFQHKCFTRIKNLRHSHATVLFVSHSLGTIKELCDRVVWFDKGQIRKDGPAKIVVDAYLMAVQEKEKVALESIPPSVEMAAACIETISPSAPENDEVSTAEQSNEPTRWGSGDVQIAGVRFLDANGKEKHVFECGESMTIAVQYLVNSPVDDLVFGYGIYREDGLQVSTSNTQLDDVGLVGIKDRGEIHITFDSLPLLVGAYYVEVSAQTESGMPFDYHSWKDRRYAFSILSRTQDAGSGIVHLERHWNVDVVELAAQRRDQVL